MKTITIFNIPVSIIPTVIETMEKAAENLIHEGEYKDAREVLYSLEDIKEEFDKELKILAAIEEPEEPLKEDFDAPEI